MNKVMNKFSSFCAALSAAVLLTAGLPGQAQSGEPEGGWSPVIDGVEQQGDYSGYLKLPERPEVGGCNPRICQFR